MKISKQPAFFFLLLIVSLTGSAQTDLARYLPGNASAVISFNSSRLKSKMSWNEFTQSKFFTMLTEKSSAEFMKAIENQDSLGLDKNPEVLLAIVNDEKKPDNGYAGLLIRMKNSTQFSNAAKKLFKNRIPKAIGNNKLLTDKDMVYGWNRDILVITVIGKNKQHGQQGSAKAATLPSANRMKLLSEQCVQLLSPKINNNTVKDPRFAELMKEDADVRMWSVGNFNPVRDLVGKNTGAITPSRLKGGAKAAVINFENGAITWPNRLIPSTAFIPAIK